MSVWLYIVGGVAGALILGAVLLITWIKSFKRFQYAPLSKDAAHKLIRQGFNESRIPQPLDAIVIGSGIGGLTTAVVLARQGKKVLVLEQHDVIGGCTHTFEEKGLSFDTGLHYIGGRVWDRNRRSEIRRLFDMVTDGTVEWQPTHVNDKEAFDVAVSLVNQDSFAFRGGFHKMRKDLEARFPNEREAIDRYFKLIRRMNRLSPLGFAPKVLPTWLGNLVKLLPMYKEYKHYEGQTTREALLKLTKDEELIGLLTYLHGDIGVPPSKSSFAIHCMVVDHYIPGAAYPIGGSERLAVGAVQLIEKLGGKCLVRGPVGEILVENGTAVGVRMQRSGLEVRAPVVVSSAGVFNTFSKLLSTDAQPYVSDALQAMKSGAVTPSVGHMYVFIALKGGQQDLKLPPYNTWAYYSIDHDRNSEEWHTKGPKLPLVAVQRETADGVTIKADLIPTNGVFVSFPSAKDPTFAERYPGRSTCEVIMEANYEWFSKWAGTKVDHRGAEYDKLKDEIGKRVLDIVLFLYPELRDKIEFVSVGTPLTNEYYLNSRAGASYGIAHSVSRFAQDFLKPSTPIKNLYLSGQDVASAGVAGGLLGGAMCGFVISPLNFLRYNLRDLVA